MIRAAVSTPPPGGHGTTRRDRLRWVRLRVGDASDRRDQRDSPDRLRSHLDFLQRAVTASVGRVIMSAHSHRSCSAMDYARRAGLPRNYNYSTSALRKSTYRMARRLPPLNAMRAFEAVARNGSVTGAARELSVTQGAVSRRVT